MQRGCYRCTKSPKSGGQYRVSDYLVVRVYSIAAYVLLVSIVVRRVFALWCGLLLSFAALEKVE